MEKSGCYMDQQAEEGLAECYFSCNCCFILLFLLLQSKNIYTVSQSGLIYILGLYNPTQIYCILQNWSKECDAWMKMSTHQCNRKSSTLAFSFSSWLLFDVCFSVSLFCILSLLTNENKCV